MLGMCDELTVRMGVKGFGKSVLKMILTLVIEKTDNKQEWTDELEPNGEIKGQRRRWSVYEGTGDIRGCDPMNLTLEFNISKMWQFWVI